ncbi:unnamed protein product [Brassicogethes aeneus]|uniref:Uncharacterized protein n=1 Tax=Brassicogethes aeneus TaxID=1431903 RepID=A0A9P0FHN1_BRAAE|nr:unnamed protein product [Brassicogethes aeneus]
MCNASLFLIFFATTLTISIMCGTQMATEGLPLGRQERGADADLIAGADFLSVFMGSTLRRAFKETYTTTTTEHPTTFQVKNTKKDENVRRIRTTPEVASTTERLVSVSSKDSSDSSVVVSVSVSSSVGRTLSNKNALADIPDQELVASEEHPSIIADVKQSAFNVEEKDPITRNSDLETSEYSRGYPASVQALPRPQHLTFNPTPDFTRGNDGEKLTPYHHTVIYHDQGQGTNNNARSVSYSTVIQSIPTQLSGDVKPIRHERNYNGGSAFANKLNDEKSTIKSVEKNWEAPTTTPKSKPKVYGQPEQNYEVDESVSLVSNGRAHGLQPTPSKTEKEAKKDDDKQKVGYVVEGRKFRKYRLEERTPDGFIVGEYGVVNHDDGSLRGVRYTADGTISPRLIYDTLMKFLSL